MTSPEERPPVEQEEDVVPHRLVLGAMAAAALFALALGVWGFFTSEHEERRLRAGPAPEVPPALLDTDLGLALTARKRAELSSYGWVDRDAGIAHIPIEEAIEALAEDAPR